MKFILPAVVAYAFVGFSRAEPPAQAEDETLTSNLEQHAELPSGQMTIIFKRGDYLPIQYRGNFVEDWSGLGLEAAPDGYRWVYVDGKAYQIRITTGLITDTHPITTP